MNTVDKKVYQEDFMVSFQHYVHGCYSQDGLVLGLLSIESVSQFKCPSDNSGKMKFLFFSTQCMSWCSFKKTMTC